MADDGIQLCERCRYDEGDCDEPVPPRFHWVTIVCRPCGIHLRRLDEALTDREEMLW